MKLLKSMIVSTLVITLFLLGIYAGIQIQYKETLDEMEKSYNIQQTIAVVNLDIGVQQDDNSIKNYSSAIIDGLDDSYVLVSASMAESGYASGKYGAVLTFPSNLSEAIESINTKEPYSVQVEFKVNSNLPQERYIDIYTKLLTLQTQVNESFNYMYMESILEEFHSAQDYANALMENNNEMIAAISAVQLGNYASYMETAVIPKGEYDPKPLPVEDFVAHASQYSDSISRLYLSSYAVAQKDFDKIEEEMKAKTEELNDTTDVWVKDMEIWALETQNYTRSVAEYVKLVDTFHEELSVWADTLAAWDEECRQYGEDVNAYCVSIDEWSQEVLDYGIALQKFCDDTEAYYTEELITQNVDEWNEWKNNVNEIYQNVIHNSKLYKAYGDEAIEIMEKYEPEIEKVAAWAEYTKKYVEYHQLWTQSVDAYYDTITLTDEEYVQNMQNYYEYLNALEMYEELLLQMEELEQEKISEINNKITEVNSKIEEYNQTSIQSIDLVENLELSSELVQKFDENKISRVENKEKQTVSRQGMDEWLAGYKTLTDGVPVYDFAEVSPETVNIIDTTEITEAKEALENLKEHKELDLEVPDDIEIIVYDEKMPKAEFSVLPEYAGSTLQKDIDVKKPELTAIPPEYTIKDAPVKPEKIQQNTELLKSLAASYNPENYLDDKVTGQVSSVLGQYGSYLETINQSIQTNQQVNIGMLTRNYTEYSMYLTQLKTQIYQLHNEEQDKLTAGIDSFVNNTSAIAKESESYIGIFAGKLPYTRNNSVTNKQFIETAVASLHFNNGNVAVQHNKVTESANSEKMLKASTVCGTILFLLVIISISVWIVQQRKSTYLKFKEES